MKTSLLAPGAAVMPANLANRLPRFPGEFLGHFGQRCKKAPTGSVPPIFPGHRLRYSLSSRKPKRELTAGDAEESLC
jgi:hypothetical protein